MTTMFASIVVNIKFQGHLQAQDILDFRVLLHVAEWSTGSIHISVMASYIQYTYLLFVKFHVFFNL
jgi:hypothetical protein